MYWSLSIMINHRYINCSKIKKMKQLIKTICLVILLGLAIVSCNSKKEPIVIVSDDFHNAVDKVVQVMVHDIFSPPVASRIFAYPDIAAYEIIALHNDDYESLAGQLKELKAIPNPAGSEPLNYQLAALIAHLDLSRKLVFSEDMIKEYRDSLYTDWENKNPKEFKIAKEYGLTVSDFISQWMDTDNYKQTRTMPKFTVISDDPSRWQPTPPAYMDGIEPHWDKIRTFVIDSAAQFKPVTHPKFSMEEGTDFYKELKEVYDVSVEITKRGDESEEIEIAQFWDCNPYVSVTRGHLMFATKKITPGAHWIGIAEIACRNDNADFDKSVMTHTKTAIAIADGFISCWDEKYRSNLIRPETLINQYIDDSWKPILQTPPFPEYTSGHSVVSGAASVALASIYGDAFSFDDDTELPYGLPVRHFDSFSQAADEAAISRMYGGIHYRAAIEVGVKQGRDIGNFIVHNLKMTN